MPDRFTRCALSAMVLITVSILVFSYIGHTLGYDLAGTDSSVESRASSNIGYGTYRPSVQIPSVTSVLGEPAGFTLAGVIGGLITGYYWTALFGVRK